MNREAIDKLEKISREMDGVGGVIVSISCMYSSEKDIPDPDYMYDAFSWLSDQILRINRNLEDAIEDIGKPAPIPCYQEQAQAGI